jgi:hypothetical protein
MVTLQEQVKAEKKEGRWTRTKRVEADLLELGISSGLAKKLTYFYPLGVLERLIKATEKRQPREPATYFLKGLKKSRMKHELQRGPIGEEDIN